MTAPRTTLYAVPHSAYSGRARSYLIKAGIPYREYGPTTEHFYSKVVPAAGGRYAMPTVELPDGRVIRDGAAIIDHFEAESGHTFSPATPKQRIVSRLFDVIGAEGLLRPGMHFRWNFDAENLEYLMFHFALIVPEGDTTKVDKLVRMMRRAAIAWGVTPETHAMIEELYDEQMRAFDRHFAAHPYLLGGRPCIGDFGLIIFMNGHLGRDPKPLSMMQTGAMHLRRWVERMNREGHDLVGFEQYSEGYLDGDEIPETLVDLLRVFAVDFVPETIASAQTINTWIAERNELPSGTVCERGVGESHFEVRGTPVVGLAQPYRFFLLKRVQDEFEALSPEDQADVMALLERCGMAPVLDVKLTRDVGLRNNLEVWL